MIKIKYQYTIPKTCIRLSIDRQYIHRQDSWSVDTELAEIALPLIQQLKNNTQSYPSHNNDIDMGAVFTKIGPYWNGVSADDWQKVLNWIIMSFQYYRDFDDIHQMYFSAYENTGYVVDILQELEFTAFCGMMLFARYYQHLWD